MRPFVAGYSRTPLPKKLGLSEGSEAWLVRPPDGYVAFLSEHGVDCKLARTADEVPAGVRFIQAFVVFRAELAAALEHAESTMARDGMIWISWPKKASKVPTEVTEDTIREIALVGDLVDVKVCAVDATWSGLKLMVRKERRGASG